MVKKVGIGKKNEMFVMVKWDKQFEESGPITREMLMESKLNMDMPGYRAWRENLHHKLLKMKMNVNVLELQPFSNIITISIEHCLDCANHE